MDKVANQFTVTLSKYLRLESFWATRCLGLGDQRKGNQTKIERIEEIDRGNNTACENPTNFLFHVGTHKSGKVTFIRGLLPLCRRILSHAQIYTSLHVIKYCLCICWVHFSRTFSNRPDAGAKNPFESLWNSQVKNGWRPPAVQTFVNVGTLGRIITLTQIKTRWMLHKVQFSNCIWSHYNRVDVLKIQFSKICNCRKKSLRVCSIINAKISCIAYSTYAILHILTCWKLTAKISCSIRTNSPNLSNIFGTTATRINTAIMRSDFQTEVLLYATQRRLFGGANPSSKGVIMRGLHLNLTKAGAT